MPRRTQAPPDAGSGYSGTPLPKKLGTREGSRVLLVGAPAGFAATLGALPAGARTASRGRGPFDIIIWFCNNRYQLETGTERMTRAAGDGMLWTCWPKKSSGVASDLTEQSFRDALLPHGLVDSKVCAIDATWSGLRFTKRRG